MAEQELAKRLRAATHAADRESVARNPWLTPALALRMTRYRTAAVSRALVENDNTGFDALERLASMPAVTRSYEATRRLALHRNGTLELGRRVAAADDDLLDHPDQPVDALIAAVDRRRPSDNALGNPSLPAEWRVKVVESGKVVNVWRILENPSTTHAEAAPALAEGRDGLSVSQWRWLEHPNADPDWIVETIEARRGGKDQSVFAHAARNPATPEGLLRRLVADLNQGRNVVENPAAASDVLALVLDCAPERKLPGWVYSRVAVHRNADLAVLDRVGLGHLPGAGAADAALSRGGLLEFLAVHATSGEQAQVALDLADGWSGTLAELLTTAAALTT